jgi:hypothetical protein
MDIDIAPVYFLEKFGIAPFRFGFAGYDDNVPRICPADARQTRQQNKH